MKLLAVRVSILFCFITLSDFAKAQITFNCSEDVQLPGCPTNLCFTLKAKIPDLKGLATSYAVNPTSTIPGCIPSYANPDDPAGTATNLNIDDRYSNIIDIGFPFLFFGTTYTQIVASTNGYLSFDLTRAGLGSHFNNRGNLPGSPNYDRAVIMGPYHDLDPSTGTSPNQRIQYQLFGTAPHRRWVLSFYKVPIFSCNSLIENTHQIVLYESTGIIEVNIFDKQICATSNNGRAMVGIMNFDRTAWVNVPGRGMTSPPWGSIGMRETWRFVPNAGNSLFKRVELYDINNMLITTGTTANIGNNTLEASFPNVCPPAGVSTKYIVKSVYEKIDDPAVEIFGSDTINVNRQSGIVFNTATTAAACANNGSITVSNVTGGTPPYEYSLDLTNWQSSNVFNNLGSGPYTVHVRDQGAVCDGQKSVNVPSSGSLSITTSSTPASCTGINDGTITVESVSGTGPYGFVIDGGPLVNGTLPFTFNNLSPGPHQVFVRDNGSNCITDPSIIVNVGTGVGVTATPTATATSCPANADGTITVNIATGAAPFTCSVDGGTPQNGNGPFTFTNLAAGAHDILITDNAGCQRPINNFIVNAGPALAATASSVATSCNGASNGQIIVTPLNGNAPFQFAIDGGAFVPGTAPYTFTNLIAGPHTVLVRDGAGCITNPIAQNIPTGPSLITTANHTDVLCSGGNTGTINVAQPAIGTPPFEYSLDNVNWQTSNTFNGLTANTYTVYYRESGGCQGTPFAVSVAEASPLSAAPSVVPVICNGEANGTITITANGGISPYEYSINGGANWQNSNVFNIAANSYNVIVRDVNNCLLPVNNIIVTQPAVLTAASVNANASCDGGNDGTITINAAGGNSGYSYSINGGAFQSSNLFNVAPGNYTVKVKDNLNCETTFSANVGLTNNLTFIPMADTIICEGNSAQLNLVSNATQYAWNVDQGITTLTINNPVVNPVVTTAYEVKATLGRCDAYDTVLVNVNAAPIPDAGPEGLICYGQDYQLQARGGVSYSWSPSTYLTATTAANPVSTPLRTITYTLSILSDANGCKSLTTDDITIDVTPPFKVRTFPFDTIGYSGDRFQVKLITDEPDANIFTWSPTIGLSDPSIAEPVVTLGNVGDMVRYRVIAETQAGCKSEAYLTVKVYQGPDVYMATAFTPNNDGKNDKFAPIPVSIKSLKYFRIYDRWGHLVFTTNKLYDAWDGRAANGIELPTGTYVWMVEAITGPGKVITKKGTVTLIR
jgi:gliding motility-associated-like protein